MTIAGRLDEARAAIQLLSRLPVWPARKDERPPLPRCIWAFPVAGALVGAVAAVAYGAVAGLGGAPPAMAAVVALVAMVLATGALHEDGLADTADGLGGGRTPERRLEIMRDSRIGAYGAMAILLGFAWRGTALAAITDPWLVVGALIGCGALSRGAMLVVLARLDPARTDGLGVTVANPDGRIVAAGLAVAFAIGAVALTGAAVLLLPLVAAAAGLGTGAIAQRRIGGHTGDILGATQQLSECAMLLALVMLLSG